MIYPKIYLAGFFDAKERLRVHRDRLQAWGFNIVSTWLEETQPPGTVLTPEESTRFALRDLSQIYHCEVFLLDTIDVSPRGGREVEYGTAGSLGKVLWIVGPKRNVFHELCAKHFETWEELFAWVEGGPNDGRA